MFSYTHVLGLDQKVSRTYTADPFSNFATDDSGVSHTGQGFVSDQDYDDTRITSYSFGTHPRSVSTIPISVSHTYYIFTSDSNGTGYETESSSTTGTLGNSGSSTGVDSFTWAYPPTQTYQISSEWTGRSGTATTALTGSASATTFDSNQTTSASLTGTTLVPLFQIDLATVQRWYGQRQHPPPLRRVMRAFAAQGDATSCFLQSISSGSNSYLSDLSISDIVFTETDSGIFTPFSSIPTTIYFGGTTTSTKFSGKSISSSATATAEFSAHRKFLYNQNVFAKESFGTAFSLDTSYTGLPLSAQIGLNLSSLSVWTNPTVLQSSTFVWRYESSSWRLYASSSNSAASSTYSIGWSVIGSAETNTLTSEAVTGMSLGRTLALLGPQYPFSQLGLNVVSASSQTSRSGVHGFLTAPVGTSVNLQSKSFDQSSSTQFTFGNALALVQTYPASSLFQLVVNPAFSMGTITWAGGNDAGAIPPLSSNSKWNEAGRLDPVSVSQ